MKETSKRILGRFRGLFYNQRGQTMVEYAVLASVLAIALAIGLLDVFDNVRGVMMKVQGALEGELVNPNGNCGNPNPGTRGGRSPCAP